MSGMILRWGVPALLTVVGGTALAIASTTTPMTAELSARANDALAAGNAGWASVSFDARDATLTGTADSEQEIDDLAAALASIPGIRSVQSRMVLAERASPYPFRAIVDEGRVRLEGAVPDAALAPELAAAARADAEGLRLMSGAPDPRSWREAVAYALEHAAHLDQGEASLADLELTIAGRAGSPDGYEALLRLERSPPPDGVRVAARGIAPPLVSPFEWHAAFDGAIVTLSGYTPTTEFAETLRRDGIAGHPVATSMRLASGAPADFEVQARELLASLVQLERGTATISDQTRRLEGVPGDADMAARITGLLAELDVALELAPPRLESYGFTARRDGSDIVLEGHVPDTATRDRLAGRDGVDAAALELARGAPDRFNAAVDFGLGLLSHMSEGVFSIENTALSVEGRAATITDFDALETAIGLGAPQGLTLGSVAVLPPLASPFTWRADKSADGVTLSGHVPSRGARSRLQTVAVGFTADSSVIADGAPARFEAEAGTALGLLPLLDTAEISYDGSNWSIRGAVATAEAALAADRAFAASGLREAGWSFAVEQPPAPEAPVADPFVWQAAKAEDGGVTLTGHVTTAELRDFIAIRAGEDAVDNTEIATGEPPGFLADVLAGLEALSHLRSGAVTLEDGTWTLAGVPETAADADLAVAALQTATAEGADWRKQLSLPIEPAVEEPSLAGAGPAAAGPLTDDGAPIVETAIAVEPDTAGQPPTAGAPAEPIVRDYRFSASKPLGGAIVLEGLVPSAATRDFLGVIAGGVPTDHLAVGEGLPQDYVPVASSGIRALLDLPSGEFGLDGDQWILTGRASSEAERAALLQRLAAIPASETWQSDITLLPAVDICRQRVAAFATRNAILFQSGSARLADESAAAIDELAAHLQLCPDTMVHVEGHTDSDGADELNLALSVARAEAVVDALIARGVAFQRLYAVGYGASLPIADNGTAAGKRANRRIAFTIVEPAD